MKQVQSIQLIDEEIGLDNLRSFKRDCKITSRTSRNFFERIRRNDIKWAYF